MFTPGSIIHGPEFWLAAVIFLIGVAVGIILWETIEWLAERNSNDKR